MTDTPMLDAYLRGQNLCEAFHDLTPQQINDMSLSEFAARTGRPTPVEAALQALGNQERQETPAAPDSAFTQTVEAAQGIDVSQMDMSQYAALRRQLGIGQGRTEGRGIFHAADRQDQLNGVRAHAGRGALSSGNVTLAPALTGRQERQGDMIDHRTRAERFGTPGNSNTF